MKAGTMRHTVNVMRPTKAEGTLGETQGNPETIIKNWPCSIRQLSGNEQEQARQNGAFATYEIKGYGNPRKPLEASDYLTLGTRTFNIASIDDENLNGVELTLLCGENK